MATTTRVIDADGALEREILIGMVTNTDFLKKAARIVNPDLFAMQAASWVSTWVMEYFDRYGESPGRALEGLFEERRTSISEADAQWVAVFLISISEQYAGTGPTVINEAYLLDRAVAHFKKRQLQVNSSRVQRLLDAGRVEEAEALWTSTLRTPVIMDDLGIDPFDPDAVLRLRSVGMRFSMSLGIGPLDYLAGPQMSEWLIMAMGPMKRGKTQFLTHCAIRAKMLGLNAVYISLESGYEDIVNRALMAAGSMVNSGNGRVTFPVFDDKGDISFVEQQRPSVQDTASVLEMIYRFKRTAGGTMLVKSFPSYTAGLLEIKRYLDALEIMQGWTPHVICVDYLGAMKPPKGYTGRDIYDVNAKGLKSLSEERKCIVFSAHQGSRRTLDAMNMSPSDIPEDVRILGHVDILYGLNQTEEDKRNGVMRMNVLIHRFRRFDRSRQAKILQQLEAGQFCLDAVLTEGYFPKDSNKPSSRGGKDDASEN